MAPGFNVVVREQLSSRAPLRDQMGSLGSALRMPGETLMRERSEHGGSLGWLVLSSGFRSTILSVQFYVSQGKQSKNVTYYVCVCMCVHVHTCGGQRLILGILRSRAPILSRLAGR